MCRLLRLLALVLASAAAAASPASAAELSPSNNPLPDSNFQGADGNQDDAARFVDWQAMDAAGRVRHSPDPNDEDSAFVGGSKENEPGNWDFTTEDGGVEPPKDNIRDAWSVVDQPDGNTFLYLGFTREASQGTAYLAFELNRDARLWNNGRADIPCRRTGDVLVSYQPKGNVVTVVLQRWVTDTTDNATGCARTGDIVNFANLSPNVAQGAVNAGEITNYLPGAYGDSIPTERFGETSLNLAALLEEAFDDDCLAFSSVWMHSRSSTAEQSNMQDYVAPRRLNIRTCAASGVKFFDSNANGIRDPGERGIPRFVVWADYDDDGVQDPGEPSSVSDNRGRYVIYDIRPPAPDRTYTLRERLARTGRFAPVGLNWICSHPMTGTPPDGTGSTPGAPLSCRWGPINVDAEPNARGRNFGDWFPARLTLRKQLEPASDPGRFNLLVNGNIWLANAGDGASVSDTVPPGTFVVSEEAVPPTDPAAYRTTVTCRARNSQRGDRRPGPVYEDLTLTAGQRAVCTFRNIVPGSPAIAIRKVGPDNATAGDVLRYRFYVENVGDVSIPEAGVQVTDPACDAPPAVMEKEDGSGAADGSPRTLDPGDVWIYRCSNRTSDPGGDCEPTRVDNTGTVTGTVGGTTVDDDDSISVIIFCPDVPPPLPPEPVGPTDPDQPGPVAPPGPTPPQAGDAGVARFLFRRAIADCIRGRVPRVEFGGTHIRRVRVFINGRLDRRLTVRNLQRRLTPRVTRRAGRYRIAVRVTFERGSGTPPLTLRGSFRICARPARTAPRVTG
jgi:uncharacterized repeat protein (TIGR01451 family)